MLLHRRFITFLTACILAVVCAGQPLPQPTAQNVTVAVGLMADLVCSVSGYQGGDTLFINIRRVAGSVNEESTISSSPTSTTVTIPAVSLEDAGQYSCTVSSGETESQPQITFFSLTIQNEFLLVSGPKNVTSARFRRVTFLCVFNKPAVVQWFRDGTQLSQGSSKFVSEVTGLSYSLTVANASYADMGNYFCQGVDSRVVIEGLSSLTITPAYVPLMVQSVQGQSSVVTSDQQVLTCPLEGVPGPSLVYWQKGLVGNLENVTMDESTSSGPFVDSEWRLDFSKADESASGHYRCVGVDELGVSARHTFFVDVTHNSNVFIWTEWYLILVYCIVGVVILVFLALIIWFCLSVRFNLCVKVTKVKRIRERIKRSQLSGFVLKKSNEPVQDEGIDDYAVPTDEEMDAEYYEEEPDEEHDED